MVVASLRLGVAHIGVKLLRLFISMNWIQLQSLLEMQKSGYVDREVMRAEIIIILHTIITYS